MKKELWSDMAGLGIMFLVMMGAVAVRAGRAGRRRLRAGRRVLYGRRGGLRTGRRGICPAVGRYPRLAYARPPDARSIGRRPGAGEAAGISGAGVVLAANAMLAPRLNARRQTLQAALAARERTASGAASADARQRELLARFSAGSGVPRSLLCDRVGGAVPERVVLTALDVEPLTGRFEAGKPMQCRENTVVIRGVAPAAADISAFVQRLSQTGYCRGVRLAGVERERDGDRLSFRIETAL